MVWVNSRMRLGWVMFALGCGGGDPGDPPPGDSRGGAGASVASGAGGAVGNGGAGGSSAGANAAGVSVGGAAGASAGGAAGASAGGGSGPVVVPTCALGMTHFEGTIAGKPYEGGSAPSDWSLTKISFGLGENKGASLGLEVELTFAEKLSVGTKVPITAGSLFVMGDHPLAGQYLCIKSGEISLVSAPPTSESVLIEFRLSSATKGRACDGEAIDIALAGCISRTSTYVP